MRTIAKGLFPVELEVANHDDRAASPVCVATVGNRSCVAAKMDLMERKFRRCLQD